VRFGEEAQSLVDELHACFPHASVAKADPDFNGWLNAVVQGIDRSTALVDLPLDIQGTAFQTRIWKALREIPHGSTTTYAELARRIGSPSAVRAVGAACSANPVAVLVPCHRVIRSDGGISGYRWGVERKRELLRREVAGRSNGPAKS
jgi:AraC family transcriptional regulator of adaptative response/methylated-DNA-[protein]-cysteine methyltransferase